MKSQKEVEVLNALTNIAAIGLEKLVKLGRVTLDEANSNWYLKFDDSVLIRKGILGAATIDNKNQPVIILRSGLSVEGYLHVISHEIIHLAQICCGDMIPMFGFTIWKDIEYKTLASDDPNYVEGQPWEKEAFELAPIIFEHLKLK